MWVEALEIIQCLKVGELVTGKETPEFGEF
jgi:hypothetical protein